MSDRSSRLSRQGQLAGESGRRAPDLDEAVVGIVPHIRFGQERVADPSIHALHDRFHAVEHQSLLAQQVSVRLHVGGDQNADADTGREMEERQ